VKLFPSQSMPSVGDNEVSLNSQRPSRSPATEQRSTGFLNDNKQGQEKDEENLGTYDDFPCYRST